MVKPTGWIITGLAIVIAAVASVQFHLRRETVRPRLTPDEGRNSNAFFFLPGIRQPKAFPAGAAAVEDDADVIGVSVKGHHRAYCMATMADLERHVINDLIDRVPVTVTYCPRTNCVRALTRDD